MIQCFVYGNQSLGSFVADKNHIIEFQPDCGSPSFNPPPGFGMIYQYMPKDARRNRIEMNTILVIDFRRIQSKKCFVNQCRGAKSVPSIFRT